MFPAPLAIIDLETTGMTATRDRITEIGIVTVVDNQVVSTWSTLINPECSIPPEIQSLTGITNAMVRDAPTFAEVADEVMDRLRQHVFVAHNARFDYGFIKNEFQRLGWPFTADVLCTVRLAKRLYPGYASYSLDSLRKRHKLSTDGRHRALGDARAAWQFIDRVMHDHDEDEIARVVKSLLKMPSLPPQLALDALDGLPEGPGVYTFYGVNDLPIYIGKAKDIRSRVRSHFSSDYRSANDQRLSVEITRLDYIETAGEFGALLLESQLVKSRMPLRNHKLRRNREVTFISLPTLDSLPVFKNVTEIDFSSTENLFGPFASKASAKAWLMSLATEHVLCWNVLSPHQANGACFAHKLHRCRGYCVGEEPLAQHNVRLVTALAEKQFPRWPANDPIIIAETHPTNGKQQVHVFQHWMHVGTANDETELSEIVANAKSVAARASFDGDVFKLLVKRSSHNANDN
jgi:DNA polymerase III subunit epsilon